MKIEFSSDIEPPPVRTITKRLTEELKGIQPGQSVLLDKPTALCLIEHLKGRGFKSTRRTEENALVRVWRMA